MTRLIFPTIAAAFVTFTSPAFAGQDAPGRSFVHDGVTYIYTAVQQGKNRVIEGTASDGGKFELTVRNGWVDGYVNNQRVTFAVPRKPLAKTQVAAR